MSFENMLTFTAIWMTQLYISMKLPSLEACVSDIRKWMAANFLLLNLDNTEMLVLGPKKQRDLLLNLTINLSGATVSPDPSCLSLQYLCCSSLCVGGRGSVCYIWSTSPVLSGVLCEFKYALSYSLFLSLSRKTFY